MIPHVIAKWVSISFSSGFAPPARAAIPVKMTEPSSFENAIRAHGTEIAAPAGARVFRPGDPCERFVVLVEGAIRVDLVSHSGRSILLYRFGAGETCVLTTACLLSGEAYNAEATVERDAKLRVLSKRQFEQQMATSAGFREFVFTSFADRLSNVMARIEDVAFTAIDARLAGCLLQHADASDAVRATHDQLASDIGSAREVVSRKLAAWERQHLVARGRGEIVIQNRDALLHLARRD